VAANQPAAPASTQPAAALAKRLIEAGDTVAVNIPQLTGSGVEAKTVQRVADGGTISLPMIEPVKVVGMTEEDLSHSITQKYRDLKVMTDATPQVSVTPAAAIPTTQPLDDANAAVAEQPPQRKALADEAFGIAPTTQQSDFVDVFIVLAPDAGAGAGAGGAAAVQTPARSTVQPPTTTESAPNQAAEPATTAPVQQ
jgi:hypothetical protein